MGALKFEVGRGRGESGLGTVTPLLRMLASLRLLSSLRLLGEEALGFEGGRGMEL